MKKEKLVPIGASIGTLIVAASVKAGGFAVRGQGAAGVGEAFAGVAAGYTSLSSMYWNPAIITQYPGAWSETNLSLTWPHTSIEVFEAYSPVFFALPSGNLVQAVSPNSVPLGSSLGNTGTGKIGKPGFGGSGYGTIQLTDSLFLALALNSPFILHAAPDNKIWSGRFYGVSSELQTYNINPAVGYRVNDSFRVAVGVQAQHIEGNLKAASLIAPFFPTNRVAVETASEFRGNSVTFGATAGVIIKPSPTTQIGFGFRSSLSHKLSGDARNSLAGNIGSATTKVSLPELVTVGFREQVTSEWTFLAGVEWTNWSRFKNLVLSIQNPQVAPVVSPQYWSDGWLFSIGTEYQFDPRLQLRAGAAYEVSPVPDATRALVPDNDRIWLSAGFSYQLSDKLAVDFGYSHIFLQQSPIDLRDNGRSNLLSNPYGPTGTLNAQSTGGVDLFSLAIRYRLSTISPRALPRPG